MKKLSALPFLFFAVQIFAQSKENDRFVLGFFAGLETQSLGVQNLGRLWPDQPAAWSSGSNAGVSAGVFARKPLWPWLHFQPELAVSYVGNRVIFWPDGPKKYRFFDAELPLHFVVTDGRRRDSPLRGCVIFGGRVGWNFVQNPSHLLQIAQERFALDLGLGAEIKAGRWRLQPAFVYSHGLNDLHFWGDAQYDEVVGRVVRDKLALRLLAWKSGK
ncbi:MAG: hypothetical protein ACKVUS_10695 [Saprospiraceae bacterium]